METLKKIGKAVLFPHIAVMIILLPIATVFLIYSMVFLGTDTIPAYISYVLAAYTLTVWCFKIPKFIATIKNIKNENKYVKYECVPLWHFYFKCCVCGISALPWFISRILLVLLNGRLLHLPCSDEVLSVTTYKQA